MDEAQIRRRLDRIVERTTTAKDLRDPGWWVGNQQGERRAYDDLEAGRLSWRTAHKNAVDGIAALDNNDLEMAELYLWSATDLYVDALEARVRPSDMAVLAKSAGKRGRPKKSKN
jgi:hypothetical protein